MATQTSATKPPPEKAGDQEGNLVSGFHLAGFSEREKIPRTSYLSLKYVLRRARILRAFSRSITEEPGGHLLRGDIVARGSRTRGDDAATRDRNTAPCHPPWRDNAGAHREVPDPAVRHPLCAANARKQTQAGHRLFCRMTVIAQTSAATWARLAGDEIASSSRKANTRGAPKRSSDPSPFGISNLGRPPDPSARPEDCASRSQFSGRPDGLQPACRFRHDQADRAPVTNSPGRHSASWLFCAPSRGLTGDAASFRGRSQLGQARVRSVSGASIPPPDHSLRKVSA